MRIPRTNLLSRFSFVDTDGSLEIRGNPKAMYATMVSIRALIIMSAGPTLRRALVLGVRYAVCRR